MELPVTESVEGREKLSALDSIPDTSDSSSKLLTMNFHQQQQMAMAQQMAAQQGQYGGGMTPQQQQQLAMAQQMGGLTPQQQQQIAMAQQMAAQYGGQPMGAAPGYAPPMAPVAAASAADGTTITCQFPDGCLIGYDRLRNELILNGKISNTRMRQIPARPSPSYGADIDAGPGVPVEKTGMMTKLGWKKTMLGGDSWQPRYFRLTDTHISYHKDPNGPAINSIPLNNGIVVNVVNAATPARKNRSTNRTFFFIIPVAHFIFPVDIDQIRRQRHSWRGHSDDHEYRCHAE